MDQVDRKTATKTAAIAPVDAIDLDIQESVSKLESDISKTIENNNNKLKEVEAEIEKLKNTKTKFDESTLPVFDTIINPDLDDDDEDEDEDLDDDDLSQTFEQVTNPAVDIIDTADDSKIDNIVPSLTTAAASVATEKRPTTALPLTTTMIEIETIATEIDLKTTTVASNVDPMVLVNKISITPKVRRTSIINSMK